jgi:hypothetical protein
MVNADGLYDLPKLTSMKNGHKISDTSETNVKACYCTGCYVLDANSPLK